MIYENVKRLCQERGINIATLEKECGLGNAIVNKWGKRGSEPRVGNLKKIADFFGVSVDELLKEENNG